MSLELDILLSPISEEYPCGADYSFSNEFQAIKKAKTQDDALLEQGDWISEPKQADWPFVAAQSVILLSEKTKDIRIYTWLMEAWSNLYGFDGIAKSLELLQKSLDKYWLQIFPEIEDDDLDQRLGLFQGFIGLLPAVLKNVPIVNSSPYFNLADYESFLYQENQKRRHQQDTEEDIPAENSLEDFERALNSTSKQVQYQNYQQFLDILSKWQQLKETFDQLMDLDAPSYSAIDSQIESIQINLKKIYKADSFTAASSVIPVAAANSDLSSEYSHTQENQVIHVQQIAEQRFQAQPQNHLANREQAMQVLQDIAEYFQLNEPHSPVSYMLQKTIKWSQMPLHEWLTHVIKNENPLANIQEVLGVQNDTNDW
jgi:type VI secretion system protein ImpA